MCIGMAGFASFLAIWRFTGRDAMRRTGATRAVIGLGTGTCWWINGLSAAVDQ